MNLIVHSSCLEVVTRCLKRVLCFYVSGSVKIFCLKEVKTSLTFRTCVCFLLLLHSACTELWPRNQAACQTMIYVYHYTANNMCPTFIAPFGSSAVHWPASTNNLQLSFNNSSPKWKYPDAVFSIICSFYLLKRKPVSQGERQCAIGLLF